MSNDIPAFPRTYTSDGHNGMMLTDWFAAHIASGMAAHSGTMGSGFGPGEIAIRSYKIADALMAERERRQGGVA